MRFRRHIISVVVCFIVVDVSLADPETVDGLLKKRSEPVFAQLAVKEPARILPEKLAVPNNKFEASTRIYFSNGFRQDSLGRNFHHGYPSGENAPMAFGSYLHLQPPQQQQLLHQSPPQLQQQRMPLVNYPIPRGPSVELPQQQQQQQIKRKEEITNGQVYPANGYQANQGMAYPFFPPPTSIPIPSEYYPQSYNQNYPQNVGKNSLQNQASVRPLHKFIMPATTTTTTTSTTTTTTTTTTTATTTTYKTTMEDENSTHVGEPQAAMLKQVGLMDAASRSAFGNEENPGQGIASLVIGLTFVAAFLSIALGLVGHTVMARIRQSTQQKPEFYGKGKRVRSPNEEDQTPPELRGCGQPSFVQPDLSPNGKQDTSRGIPLQHGPGSKTGAGFFTGKLIFHDPPGNYLRSNGTHHLPSSSLGAIPKQKMLLPTRAAVTDDLISPKYEDEALNDESTDDGDDEDEESDDTVYECPGLASAKGGIVIKNPFFLANGTKGEGSSLPPPLEAVKAHLPGQTNHNNNNSNNNNFNNSGHKIVSAFN